MNRTLLAWLGALLILQSNAAFAGVRFSLAGALNLMTPKIEPIGTGNTTAPRMGLGGGVLLEVATGRQLSLDVGVLYVTRKSALTDALDTIVTSYSAIQVPVVIRIWTNPYLSFGLGGHYTRTVGNVTSDDGTTVTTGAPSNATDYGVLASVAVELPITNTVQFFADGRYVFGIADNDPSSATKVTQNEIQVLVGLRFGESWIKN